MTEDRNRRYYGTAAVDAIFATRKDQILRVYLTEEARKDFSDLVKWCTGAKKPYKISTSEEIEKHTKSIHHQGICVVAPERPGLDERSLLRKVDRKDAPGLLIYLDGVENPHNLGAFLRTAAHFGVEVVLGGADLPLLSPSACRMAEGGAEFVSLARLANEKEGISKLRRLGYTPVSTVVKGGQDLYKFKFPEKTLLVFGKEVSGVSAKMAKLASESLSIPGTGAVESLNVAAAGAIFLAEYWRQWRKDSPRV